MLAKTNRCDITFKTSGLVFRIVEELVRVLLTWSAQDNDLSKDLTIKTSTTWYDVIRVIGVCEAGTECCDEHFSDHRKFFFQL